MDHNWNVFVWMVIAFPFGIITSNHFDFQFGCTQVCNWYLTTSTAPERASEVLTGEGARGSSVERSSCARRSPAEGQKKARVACWPRGRQPGLPPVGKAKWAAAREEDEEGRQP
jgi:hypothetical protein